MSFRKRYRQALVFKDLDVEEPIDVRFHRPLAAMVTAVAIPTPITPNQITVTSLLVGWTGSFFLYQAFFGHLFDGTALGQASLLFLAGFFLFASVIFDCADGQLARARGGGSRVGRILDGVVDALVLLPAYVLLGFGIKQEFGTLWIWISALAGVTSWIRTIVYDKVKTIYLARTNPAGGESAGIETPEEVRADYEEACRSGSLLERVLLRIYLTFLLVRDSLASGDTQDAATGRSPAEIEAYRNKHRTTMRLTSMMGLGTHMLFIYGSIALAFFDLRALIGAQAILASLFNILLVIVLVRSRSME